MRPVILVSEDASTFEVYPSVTAAAEAVALHPSTVHRALTGDRNCLTVTTDELFVLDWDDVEEEDLDGLTLETA